MKVAELRQIIKEEMGKLMEEPRDIEWRDVTSIFESALDEVKSHDQYAYADTNEVEEIALRLVSEIKDLVRKQNK
jgi:hypothetical protein